MKIKFKILTFSAIAVVVCVALGASGSWGLRGLTQANASNLAMAAALRQQMDADMMHDALRADVIAAVLTAVEGKRDKVGDLEHELKEHAERFRTTLARTDAALQDASIKQKLAEIRPAADRYVAAA